MTTPSKETTMQTKPVNGDVIHTTPDCLEQALADAAALAQRFGVRLWVLIDDALVLRAEDARIGAEPPTAATLALGPAQPLPHQLHRGPVWTTETSQTDELRAALTAPSLDALCAAMPDAYEQLGGSYTSLPTWGEPDEEVERRIRSSCGAGDIVSWDTTTQPHRYLQRYTDCGRSFFEIREADAELAADGEVLS